MSFLIAPPLESLPVKESEKGCFLYVKVSPKASKSCIGKIEPGQFHPVLKVFVMEAAIDGKANEAVIEVIAKHFNCAKKSVTISTGHTQRLKTLFIDGLTVDQVIRALI